MNNELRLIRKIQKNGDRNSADKLVRHYYDEIYRFMHKQTSDNEVSLDLTQEVFISLLKSINRYDPKKGAGLRTWLYKIAANKSVDYFRSQSTHTGDTISIDEDYTEPIDQADFTLTLENCDFSEQVCNFVSRLPIETQKIFRLHIFAQHTFAEIAESMEIPESSIKSKYYRLIKTLRREFASYG